MSAITVSTGTDQNPAIHLYSSVGRISRRRNPTSNPRLGTSLFVGLRCANPTYGLPFPLSPVPPRVSQFVKDDQSPSTGAPESLPGYPVTRPLVGICDHRRSLTLPWPAKVMVRSHAAAVVGMMRRLSAAPYPPPGPVLPETSNVPRLNRTASSMTATSAPRLISIPATGRIIIAYFFGM